MPWWLLATLSPARCSQVSRNVNPIEGAVGDLTFQAGVANVITDTAYIGTIRALTQT